MPQPQAFTDDCVMDVHVQRAFLLRPVLMIVALRPLKKAKQGTISPWRSSAAGSQAGRLPSLELY
jgi:hypothetical protein